MGSGMRAATIFVAAFALLAGTCDDGDATTTSAADVAGADSASAQEDTTGAETSTSLAAATTAAPDTTAPPETTEAPEPTTTTAAADSGPECLSYWSESLIRDLVGDNWSFSQANIDGTTCTFTSIPSTIGVFFRASDLAGFEAAKQGAALTGTLVEFTIETCDAAYFIDIGGAIVVAESYSDDQGRVFNATVSGVDDAVAVATSLIQAGCEGPFED